LYGGGVDGEFGLITKAATEKFQQGAKLSVDGVVGNETVGAAIPLGFHPVKTDDGGGWSSQVERIERIEESDVYQLADGSAMFFTAGMDIDADGAPEAYNPENTGLDINSDAKDGDTWVGIVVDDDGEPVVQQPGDPAPGFYVSTTSLEDTSKEDSDPRRYLDATTVPYIVIPGGRFGQARLGHPVLVVDERTGQRVKGIVGDIGPRFKIGEASMFLAASIVKERIYELNDPDPGKFSNPREGGTSEKRFRYIILTGLKPLSMPCTVKQIAAAVDGGLENLNHDQLLAVTLQ
jgi:hypothetical protein